MLDQQTNFYPFFILLTSLLGSWHCAGMCGPIACSAHLNGKAYAYHFGRLCTYLFLGFIAGSFGNFILNQIASYHLLSSLIVCVFFLTLGLSFFFKWNWTLRYPNLLKFYKQKFLLGLFTGFLPCGWLYSFVIAATLTRSSVVGLLTLFIFWVGTVPALTLMSSGFRQMTGVTQGRLRILTGTLFIISGIYSLIAHHLSH